MELTKSPTRKPLNPKAKAEAEKEKEENPFTEISVGFQIDPNRVYTFETIKKSDMPRSENLGATCKAFDNVEKRYRDMRYHPTAPSIFTDEQDESYNDLPTEPLVFWRNVIYVQGEDIRKMEYMLNHPLYEHSPFRVVNKPAFFTLADKEVQEEIKAKRHEIELKALEAIKNTNIDDLKPIARTIFGITDESEKAIINELNERVKKPKAGLEKMSNAEKLLDNIGNPKLLRNYHVQEAIDRGIISADLNKMQVRMIDGNIFICNLSTKNPVKELTDWTFTEEGGKWYTQIRKKI